MKLQELAAGFSGAPNGSVEIKKRETTTDASVFTDFTGGSLRTGSRHTLDSNGALQAFVSEPVDIYVYDSAGALVYTSTSVTDRGETTFYAGQSFTGTDPVTAKSAVNKPVAVSTVLDLFKTAFGSTDLNLQKDVASTPATWSPKRLSITVGTAFLNIKDPAYGAIGDGTTDDTAAIQAAIDAAEAAGGGIVLLPPGTYKVTGALVIDSPGVSVVGIGAPIVVTTSSSANVYTITADRTVISDHRINVSDAVGSDSTGYGISISGADYCTMRNVEIGRGETYKHARAISITTGSVDTTVVDSAPWGVGYGIYVDNAGEAVYLTGCSLAGTYGIYVDNANYSRITGNKGGSFYIDTSIATLANNISLGQITLTADANYIAMSGNHADSGVINNSTNNDNTFVNTLNEGGAIASTAALELPNPSVSSLYTITGTADITSISATGWFDGSVVYLKFTGTAAATGVTDGSNLVLAGNFAYTPNDVLTLMLDGANWTEISRSAN